MEKRERMSQFWVSLFINETISQCTMCTWINSINENHFHFNVHRINSSSSTHTNTHQKWLEGCRTPYVHIYTRKHSSQNEIGGASIDKMYNMVFGVLCVCVRIYLSVLNTHPCHACAHLNWCKREWTQYNQFSRTKCVFVWVYSLFVGWCACDFFFNNLSALQLDDEIV